MIRAIDTHAHLDFDSFDEDRDEVINDLERNGIGVINISSDLASIEKTLELAHSHPIIWASVGVHPDEITPEVTLKLPGLMESWSKIRRTRGKIVAIGEVGLDYYNKESESQINLQKAALRQFLEYAKSESLPIIFHCREAYGDLATILRDYPGISGVIHCFSGEQHDLEAFLDLGLYISFTGMLTYPKNEWLREASLSVSSDRLLLETDSPFLSVGSNRGKRNNPKAILEIAALHATLRLISVEEVLVSSLKNTEELFNIKSNELD